jgi:hypothetical protein
MCVEGDAAALRPSQQTGVEPVNDTTTVAQSIAHSLAEYHGEVHIRDVAARLRTYDGDETTRAFFTKLADDLDELAARRAHERAS